MPENPAQILRKQVLLTIKNRSKKMPEFETRKRKTMSEQELYREYHGDTGTAKKADSPKRKNTKKKKSRPASKEPSSAISNRKRVEEEIRRKQKEAKRSKTYAGKTS